MTSDPLLAQPLASGREADVYALAGGRELRRYRGGEDAAPEAEVIWTPRSPR